MIAVHPSSGGNINSDQDMGKVLQTGSSFQSKGKYSIVYLVSGFPNTSVGKESACNAVDTGDGSSIPGSGRCPAEGNGNPLQYSCLENPMDRGAWWATVHGVTKSQTRLSN